MPPQTIDEVLAQTDEIIFQTRREQSRLGYFATLYRNVTIKVKAGIAAGMFEDGPRMARLDVTFANRFLAAYDSYRRGERPSRCWLVAFEAAATWPPIILQHLLLGINAHINFDLGIAAQQVAPGAALLSLQHDFDQINNILGGMIVKVRSDVEEVSPWIKYLDQINPRAEDEFINFSLGKARQSAWLVAMMLNSTPPADLPRKLRILDDGVAQLGVLVRQPHGLLLRLGLHVIRARESNDIPHVIDVLSQT